MTTRDSLLRRARATTVGIVLAAGLGTGAFTVAAAATSGLLGQDAATGTSSTTTSTTTSGSDSTGSTGTSTDGSGSTSSSSGSSSSSDSGSSSSSNQPVAGSHSS